MYEDSRALLERRFRELDADADGRLSSGELADICGVLGVPVTAAEAEALVDKLGGARGSLPFAAFRKAMLTHPLRQLADSAPVRRGAFVAGQSAAFHGKIIYPPCRTGVFTPSDWDPALAGRSAELPETRLHLEFVYGYDGVAATSPNLFYSASGDPIYSTAGVGVVYLRPRGPGQGHAQRFFLGHDDDVRCLAVLDAPVRVKGREYPARTLAATGQVSSVEHGPVVFVWDTGVGSQEGDNVVARIEFGKSARGIQTLAFSPCGRFLTCVATDNQHTVYVYDWARGKVLSEGMGFSGEPPQVFGVAWDAYGSERFVTFGRKHAKLWARAERGRGWEGRTMSFGKAPICNVTSAAFLPRPDDRSPQYVVCGVSSGSLYVFRDGKCVKEVQAHARGESACPRHPVLRRPAGPLSRPRPSPAFPPLILVRHHLSPLLQGPR